MIIRNIITRTHSMLRPSLFQKLKCDHHTLSNATRSIKSHSSLASMLCPTCHNNFTFNKMPQLINNQKSFKHSSTTATTTSKEESGSTKINETVPLTNVQKFKKAVAEYGSTVIIFHVTISLISLGSSYLLVSMGLDASKVLITLGLDKWLDKNEIAAGATTFALAYALHKVFAPVRIMITLTSVPFIVKFLRNKGFLKKVGKN